MPKSPQAPVTKLPGQAKLMIRYQVQVVISALVPAAGANGTRPILAGGHLKVGSLGMDNP